MDASTRLCLGAVVSLPKSSAYEGSTIFVRIRKRTNGGVEKYCQRFCTRAISLLLCEVVKRVTSKFSVTCLVFPACMHKVHEIVDAKTFQTSSSTQVIASAVNNPTFSVSRAHTRVSRDLWNPSEKMVDTLGRGKYVIRHRHRIIDDKRSQVK